MSRENVELVQAVFEHTAAGDFELFFDLLTQDFVLVTSPEIPDAGTYEGADARRWLRTWIDSFEDLTVRAVEVHDVGDEVVVGFVQAGRPPGSEAPIEGRWWGTFTLRDGAIAATRFFNVRSQAFDVAGSSK